jgi:hypothetical protein
LLMSPACLLFPAYKLWDPLVRAAPTPTTAGTTTTASLAPGATIPSLAICVEQQRRNRHCHLISPAPALAIYVEQQRWNRRCQGHLTRAPLRPPLAPPYPPQPFASSKRDGTNATISSPLTISSRATEMPPPSPSIDACQSTTRAAHY